MPIARRASLCVVVAFALLATAWSSFSAEPGSALPPPALIEGFEKTIRPFVSAHCSACHGAEAPEGDLDLAAFEDVAGVLAGYRRWQIVGERLQAGDMPPEDAEQQPTAAERQAVLAWIGTLRQHVVQQSSGDPGPVLARRLSNAEYDYTIRDLTGVDMGAAREFPVDPANEAGFDNSGESLAMSPALLRKYLDAARQVASHLLLTPDGAVFAPHPVLVVTDRDKYAVKRIVEFYARQPTDYAVYFAAAWRYRFRAELGVPEVTLAEVAQQAKVSEKYLATMWATLEAPEASGPLAKLQVLWRALPAPENGQTPATLQAGCDQMRDFVVELRKKLTPEVPNLRGGRVHSGSQPLLMWKNNQWAANRRRYDPKVLQPPASGPAEAKGEPAPDDVAEYDDEERRRERKPPEPDADLTVPTDPAERAKHEAAFAHFCDVFPDAFYIAERGRTYANQAEELAEGRGGRLLNAGFHSMTGYYRDDRPLYDLVLTDSQQQELDKLWDEFFFTSDVAARMHTSFLWFERSDSSFMLSEEFNFTRAEDKNCTDEAVLAKLAEAFEAKAAKNRGRPVVLQAIREHFAAVNKNVRWHEQARRDAEPHHLAALQSFAERAYRRPLGPAERASLLAFYQSLRGEGMGHEAAIRDSFAAVLMSPHFCYRIDQAATNPSATNEAAAAGQAVRPLSDYELASRLSYFLWSSMPDAELLSLAAAGELHKPDVLTAQARRLLRDPRARALAVEFGGNWLDFRRFEEHNAVDRERFPTFNDELRQAMYEEPVRFLQDLVQNDRSVLDALYGEHTFVNGPLAQHYGMPHPANPAAWVRVDDAARYQRGGLLPMAVFLTVNSPGLRTSPVKRGYWVVRRVLGEQIPPPPPDVPEIPNNEAELGKLTLREVLALHRADKACAGCHARFDSFGLVFEGFGPVGERRELDLGGRPVDVAAEFPDGSQESGIEGLRNHLRTHRQPDFVDNLCRKLLAYGLGRTLINGDEALVESMKERLAANEHRFGVLVDAIVTSPQFLNKRSGGAAESPLAGE